MESFEAIVRELLARIRIHQFPRRVPKVEEVLPDHGPARGHYSAPETTWGTAPRRRTDDAATRRPRPRLQGSRRREESRLPRASAVPTPRGLLACHPRGGEGS